MTIVRTLRAPLAVAVVVALALLLPLALAGPVASPDAPPRGLLALVALLGVVATYGFVARLVDARAGAYAAVALATMPLYFTQSWAALEGVLPMAALAAAFGGLVVAVAPGSILFRALALAIGIGGVAVGWWTAGPIAGACVPLLSVGLSWALARSDRFGAALAVLQLVAGIVAACIGAQGFASHAAETGFDVVLGHLGHALAPWSAFIPFALARVVQGSASRPQRQLSTALLIGSGLAVFTHGWMAGGHAELPFVAPALLAAACGVALRDFEDDPPSLGVGVSVAALLFVLYHDFKTLPDKVLAPIGAGSLDIHELPNGFKATSALLFAGALGVFAVAMLAATVKDRNVVGRARFGRVLVGAARGWNGVALQVYFALLAALIAAHLAIVFGTRAQARWALGVSAFGRDLLLYALVATALLPVALVVVPLLHDAAAWVAERWLRGRRGAIVALGGAVAGAILAVRHYPALASEVSPTYALDAFESAKRAGDEIALLNVPPKSTHLNDARSFTAVQPASEWLLEPTAPRRFLLFPADALATLNPLYRAKASANLPVLDAQSSRILLAASRLADGDQSEENRNPLAPFVLGAPPTPDHPLDADLGDEVEVKGFDLVDANGAREEAMVPGRPSRLRIYFHARKRPTTAWQVFVHVDGHGRRETSDHPPLGGRYPATSWLPGDWLVDEHDVVLSGSFTPGTYHLYFGLFVGDNRLKATRGEKDGDGRVDGGELRVR